MENTVKALVEANEEKIRNFIEACFDEMMRSNFTLSEQVYIWEDGELDDLVEVGYSSGWLQPKDSEPRELYHLATLYESDPSGWSTGYFIEDEEEAEEAYAEALNWWRENKLDEIMAEVYEAAERYDEDEERMKEYD